MTTFLKVGAPYILPMTVCMDMSMADRRGIVYELWCSVERELRGWKERLLLGLFF
jgi:hypothetical protein